MLPRLTGLNERLSPIWKSVVFQFERGWQSLMPSERRITESYSKAVEQLAHAQIEVRLGGIYTLERISRESRENYRAAMETLCTFVRKEARWEKEPGEGISSPQTDIAGALAVIVQRRERNQGRLDLGETDLRGANLIEANLSRAFLLRVNLRGAGLMEANLSGAFLIRADLSRACLIRADLSRAFLDGANFNGADLSGANLSEARNLSEEQLANAIGDDKTQLPNDFPRPAHWPPYYKPNDIRL
jgi:hypothetical protein